MLSKHDIPHFFASPCGLDLEDYVILEYRFATDGNPELAAANLCCEQSTVQWQRPGVDEDFRPLHGAKVISLEKCSDANFFKVEIAHPHRNFGPRIPNLLTVAAGEGPFYCPGIKTIKWIDFQLPESFLNKFDGPKFGLNGMRDILGIFSRPFFMGVVKPNIGLLPTDFADIAYQGWLGGLDMAKDDEMLANTIFSPLSERVHLASEARMRAEEKTGQKKIFIANITDEVDRIGELHDVAVENGANTVMINSMMTGISAVRALRKRACVPIMSHFAGTAVFSRMPDFGVSSVVATKLLRLAGADIIGIAGFGERMACDDSEVIANIKACLEPWGDHKQSLPVPGGGDSAKTLPGVYKKIGHTNFGFICGRGVFAYPEGPEAGARSLHEAWKSIQLNQNST
jgi:ribulose-bisphosphate carboxylase large chain